MSSALHLQPVEHKCYDMIAEVSFSFNDIHTRLHFISAPYQTPALALPPYTSRYAVAISSVSNLHDEQLATTACLCIA